MIKLIVRHEDNEQTTTVLNTWNLSSATDQQKIDWLNAKLLDEESQIVEIISEEQV